MIEAPTELSSSNPLLRYSAVVPVYNEELNIEPLYNEIRDVFEGIGEPWEVLFVNDASTDDSAKVLQTIASHDARVRVLTLERNSGQGAALFKGMHAARGALIVTMDGDGQNVPADIGKLILKMDDGVDMVVGIRATRRDSALRRWMSRIANRVRGQLLGDGMTDSGCALKVMRREVVDSMIPMQTLYSFVPALAAGAGFRIAEVPVQHRERQSGHSNYGLLKMLWRPAVDMMGVAWFNRRRSDKRLASESVQGGAQAGVLLTISIVAAFILFVGNHGLLEPDEGRYGEVAREMAESGNLFIPTLNGFFHVEKPPFIYWVTTVCYKVFGVSESGARLPSVLAGLGTIFLTFQIARMLSSSRVAWLAALILASTLEFFFLARTLTPDMTMCFWITAAIACLVKHHTLGQRSLYSWLFFIAMGLGFLTKGPMAIIVPSFAALGLAVGRRRNQQSRLNLPWLLGGLVCLSVALSWFIVASAMHPQLYDYFVKKELVERFLSSSHGRSQPWWFFVPILIAGFLPWTFFLLRPAGIFVNKLKNRQPIGNNAWLLAGWLIPPFLILSVSGSKLLTYVLPLFPALAIATALSLCFRAQLGRKALYIFAAVCVAFGLAAAISPLFVPESVAIHWSPPAIAGFAIAATGLVWFARKDLPAESPLRSFAFALASLVCLLSAASQVPKANHLLAQQASVRELAAVLKNQPDFEGARIVSSNIRAHGLEFYLGRTVDVTRGQADLVFPPNKDQESRLHKSAKKVKRLKSDGRALFVITRTGDFEKIFESQGWQFLVKYGDFVLARKTDTTSEIEGATPVPPVAEP
ncbi:MAG: glycosyltransferase [Verrucomicrobiae bacterium]|nr:glycosyltransferase [Verrucomicrobiae bacterium]